MAEGSITRRATLVTLLKQSNRGYSEVIENRQI
nr:hypothetical protein Hi04_10k_c4997_00010 [uncultured bacterium]